MQPHGEGPRGRNVDFGRTAEDYGRWRQGFPISFFFELEKRGLVFDGRRVLDLGTGTGLFARDLAHRGGRVTGLDIAPEMIERAAAVDRDMGTGCDWVVAQAEDTGLPAASFDIVTCAQSWHWFDVPRVCREIRRLLVPGGRVILAHLDWLPLPGSIVEATEALILAHNPEWPLAGRDGLHPEQVRDLQAAGFGRLESFSFDVDLGYTHDGWRGRVRASAGIGASLAPEAVVRFDTAHVLLLAERFPEEPVAVPHRLHCVLGRRCD